MISRPATPRERYKKQEWVNIMSDRKIKISLDEVNNTNVDAELHRQDVALRMAQHQEKIRVNFANSPSGNMEGEFFRSSIIYMAVFGMIFSVAAWGLGEGVLSMIRHATSITEMKILSCFYWIALGTLIAIGLSIAEGWVTKNVPQMIKNGLLGGLLGVTGGFVVSLFINRLYNALGGGGDNDLITQIFARGIGWGVLGLFMAIAPGIAMKSSKKLLLGIAGGFIGGLIGGLLFDPICIVFKSVVIARFVNIVGLGVGAAMATVLLENVAKQGWLKVSSGLIAGKQFILYRNPTIIGSSPKCEIYLFKDHLVAPRHAELNSRNGDFIISSVEGASVIVNNEPVQQRRLKNGDEIKIGNTIFVFEAKALKKQ